MSENYSKWFDDPLNAIVLSQGKKGVKAITESKRLRAFDYYKKLLNTATTVFEWEGLPPGMSSTYVEKKLIEHGSAVFFKDNQLGYIIMEAKATERNIFDEPVNYTISKLKYNWERSIDDAVYIKAQPEFRLERVNILRTALILLEIDLNIMQNLQNLKTPLIVAADPDQFKNVMTLFEERMETSVAIFQAKKTGQQEKIEDMFSVLDLGVDYNLDNYMAFKREIIAEFLRDYGIEAKDADKKERMVVDEININSDQITHNRNIKLKCRQDAAQAINEMFGTSISVKFSDLDEDNIEKDKEVTEDADTNKE